MFVNIRDDDVLGLVDTTTPYTRDYLQSHVYVPTNEEFSFNSIYPRLRAQKIVFRLLTNVFFVVYAFKFYGRSKANRDYKKLSYTSQRKLKIQRFLIRLMMSTDHTNVGVNLIMMATSLKFQLSKFDFTVIIIDIAGLICFQLFLITVYLRKKNQ
jgi:hypothetical protein